MTITPEEIARLRELHTCDCLTPRTGFSHEIETMLGALPELLSHIEAQAKRIVELERELEPLRKGTHWMAPWEATKAMNVGIRMTPWPEDCGAVYARMRDAYLAEQAKE